MDRLRVLIVQIFVLLMVFTHSALVYAFHEGGVGYCQGCHKLHSTTRDLETSEEEKPTETSTKRLIKSSDPSSTCLQCHASEDASNNVLSSDGSIYSPGGDFYWLKKAFTWTVDGRFYQSTGDSHGHNIVAMDYGLNADRRLITAPGGTYPAAALSCTSCHDPHASSAGTGVETSPTSASQAEEPVAGTNDGNYRLLGGIGYDGGRQAPGVSFNYGAPIALANSLDWTETDSNHTAYGSGMSEWCANCHTEFLNDAGAGIRRKHPSGNNAKIPSALANNYNSYIKTGDLSDSRATAYLALVPFEIGTSNTSLLSPSSIAGPDSSGNSNVMCLTCHRAHASAFRGIGRWDFRATFIANSHPKAGDGGATSEDMKNSYYGRDMTSKFGPFQRQLCNKCHIKD
jgi:hypothetical protein